MATFNHNSSPLELYCRGMPLNAGICPTLFYFAAGGKQSLHQDPFSQPVDQFLDGRTRVIAVDLPFHGEGCDPAQAMTLWALSLASGEDFIGYFLDQCSALLDNLIKAGSIDASRFAVAGLSRGGFFAAHLAARHPWIKPVLAFAPVTSLERLPEFEKLTDHPLLRRWSLELEENALASKRLRFYIGNNDTRVDTDACYGLLRKIVHAGKQTGIHSPLIEMVMTPSVGYKGHGTLPHVFEDGITWLKGIMEH